MAAAPGVLVQQVKVDEGEASSSAASSYRPDIDGLRAFAVLAVIIFHMDERWLPGGFVGVDIFFVISGYVVAGSILRKVQPSRSQYCAHFFGRRLKRLTPSLIFTTTVTSLMMSLLIDPASTPGLPSYYEAAMLGLVGCANNFLGGIAPRDAAHDAKQAAGSNPANASFSAAASASASASATGNPANAYFSRQGGTRDASALELNPFTHYWSLDVEEQFYVVFPLLMLAAYRTRVVAPPLSPAASPPRLAAASPPPPHRTACRATALLVATLLAGVAVSAYMSAAHLQLAYFLMPPRLWELLCGALLFDLHAHHRGRCPWLWDNFTGRCTLGMLSLCGGALLLTSVVYTREDAHFPFPWAGMAVVGSLCFISAGEAMGEPGPRVVRLQLWGRLRLRLRLDGINAIAAQHVPVYVGLISYPLYVLRARCHKHRHKNRKHRRKHRRRHRPCQPACQHARMPPLTRLVP